MAPAPLSAGEELVDLLGVARTAGVFAGGFAAVAATFMTRREVRLETSMFFGSLAGALLGHLTGALVYRTGETATVVRGGVDGLPPAISAGLLGAAAATTAVMLALRVRPGQALPAGSLIAIGAGITVAAAVALF